jgi:phosphatidylglycerophosphatase A
LWRWGGHWTVLVGAAIVALAGWWSAGVAATRLGKPDPGPVVIDEVAGQMVSLLFLAPTMATLIAGFLLFRLFDIWKPFPVRRLEKLPAASGIMTDDLMAAVYANLVQRALSWGFPGWWGSA